MLIWCNLKFRNICQVLHSRLQSQRERRRTGPAAEIRRQEDLCKEGDMTHPLMEPLRVLWISLGAADRRESLRSSWQSGGESELVCMCAQSVKIPHANVKKQMVYHLKKCTKRRYGNICKSSQRGMVKVLP